MLGNPPWERVKIQEKEWFSAAGRDDIADAGNAAKRREAIEDLADYDPILSGPVQVRPAQSGGHGALPPQERPLPPDRTRRREHLQRVRRDIQDCHRGGW